MSLLEGMDLSNARERIQKSLDRMNAVYKQPVFDEWAVFSLLSRQGAVLAYAGPRVEHFHQHLSTDAEPLRAIAAGKSFEVGDFEFAMDAGGTRYDAFMKIGPASYLVCNHTGKTMSDIRSAPPWLKAQRIFFELSEIFRADPLTTNP